MSSEQIAMSAFSPSLPLTTEEATLARKNSGFRDVISTSSNRNPYENRRFISSTSNIPADSELAMLKSDFSRSLLTAANISSQNFVGLQSLHTISTNDSCFNMQKSEQLADFDINMRMTHKNSRLVNNSTRLSSHQPLSTMDVNISNSFTTHMFPPSTLPHHHYLENHKIPSAIMVTAAATTTTSNVVVEEKVMKLNERYRGELSILEKYRYDLSRAQLKASSRTSALLAGFAMVALVELQYERTTPPFLLITLGVVTTLLVSVHLLALMMSTCILPYIEANGCTQDSPHIRLKFYIDLSWLFSTCIGLILFLIEIGIIFFVKFYAVNYITAAYITTAMLIPVVVVFTIFSCLIHKSRFIHSINRVGSKAIDLQKFLNENSAATSNIPNAAEATPMERYLVGAGLQSVRVIHH
uniref:Protein orai n=1 Tax=Elaeophora elaphi TaxID=1147741 RepID=A0A0R3S251_9BILA